MTLSVFPAVPDSPPSASGCRGADKSRTAPAHPAPFLRPLLTRPLLPPGKVSGGCGSRTWPRWSRAQEGSIHSAVASLGTGPELTACTGARGTWVEGRALGGHLTLSLFASAERKRERSPSRLSPKSSSRAAPKSARCSPAPSSPAPQLWCVAQAGPGARGPDHLARASTLLNGSPRGRTHRPLGTALPSPITSVSFSPFPPLPGASHSAPPLHSRGGEPPRPSCQAQLGVGQTLLAPRSGAAPHPTSSDTLLDRGLARVGVQWRVEGAPEA